MGLYTSNKVSIDNNTIIVNDKVVSSHEEKLVAEDVYRTMQMNYPKFFKMDILCKWAMIGAEYLLRTENGYVYDSMDKTKIAVVLMTNNGCLEVDKKYLETTKTIAGPALFVYTLPNIMLGEICIKHGFKGEQLCLVSEEFDKDEMIFWVNDLLQNRNMDACLYGWMDAVESKVNLDMYWITCKK